MCEELKRLWTECQHIGWGGIKWCSDFPACGGPGGQTVPPQEILPGRCSDCHSRACDPNSGPEKPGHNIKNRPPMTLAGNGTASTNGEREAPENVIPVHKQDSQGTMSKEKKNMEFETTIQQQRKRLKHQTPQSNSIIGSRMNINSSNTTGNTSNSNNNKRNITNIPNHLTNPATNLNLASNPNNTNTTTAPEPRPEDDQVINSVWPYTGVNVREDDGISINFTDTINIINMDEASYYQHYDGAEIGTDLGGMYGNFCPSHEEPIVGSQYDYGHVSNFVAHDGGGGGGGDGGGYINTSTGRKKRKRNG